MSQLADKQQNDQTGESEPGRIRTGEIELETVATPETPEAAETDTPQEEQQQKSKPIFNPEQQEHLNRIISETIRRERESAEKIREEEKRLQAMTEQEKIDHALKVAQAERDEARAEVQRFRLATTASSHLIAEGLGADQEILEFVIRDSEDGTVQAVKELAKLVKKEAQRLLSQQLTGKPPKATPSTPTGKTVTKEEIAKVTDPVERQRLIVENIHLYTK